MAHGFEALGGKGLGQRLLGHGPLVFASGILLRLKRVAKAEGQLEVLVAEGREHELGEVDDPEDLVGELIGRAEYVSIVLGKSPDPEHPVEGAASLVAVDGAHLGVADGQLPVASQLSLVNYDVAGAVHGFDDVFVLVDVQDVHVFAVEVVVAAGAEDPVADDVGDGNQLVAAPCVLVLPEALDDLPDDRPLGVPVDEPSPGHIMDTVEVELPAEHAVVSLAGLLKRRQVGLQGLGRGERGAVDALEHLIVLEAPPVGPGYRQ